MTNTQVYALTTPRSDARVARTGAAESFELIPATATATAAPDGDTPYVLTGPIDTVRVFVAYSGAVTSGDLRLWVLQDGAWYRAGDIPLTPAEGNEVIDANLIGTHTRFTIQVRALEGGGTAAVRILGVW